MAADNGFRAGAGRLYEDHYGEVPTNVIELVSAGACACVSVLGVHMRVFVHVNCQVTLANCIHCKAGLFSSFVWEQGFVKVRESSRTLELFEGFDVQSWETGPWAPPPTFKSSRLVVYVYKYQ